MGDMSRSMSSFKVKGEIEVQSCKRDIAVSRTHLVIITYGYVPVCILRMIAENQIILGRKCDPYLHH